MPVFVIYVLLGIAKTSLLHEEQAAMSEGRKLNGLKVLGKATTTAKTYQKVLPNAFDKGSTHFGVGLELDSLESLIGERQLLNLGEFFAIYKPTERLHPRSHLNAVLRSLFYVFYPHLHQ